MGVFVDWESNNFSGLANIPTTLLTANTNVILINKLAITNRGVENIRFNLQKIRTQSLTPNTIIIDCIIQQEIPTYQTLDIIQLIGPLQLQFSVTPSISDSLMCFSNGYTQIFDCDINYVILNELPT